MLIRSRQEERIVPQEPVAARNHVSRNRRIGVPNVWARVNVVNRGSEIELWLGHAALKLSLAGSSAAVPRPATSTEGKSAQAKKVNLPPSNSPRFTINPPQIHHKKPCSFGHGSAKFWRKRSYHFEQKNIEL
jgi:hypothetical protein